VPIASCGLSLPFCFWSGPITELVRSRRPCVLFLAAIDAQILYAAPSRAVSSSAANDSTDA
jgi:hypothetical protein